MLNSRNHMALKIVFVLICALLSILLWFDPIPLDGVIPIFVAVASLVVPAFKKKAIE